MLASHGVKFILILSLILVGLTALGQAECRPVNGHIVSEVVAVLPNGDPCPSPIGLCTTGRFIGGLKGKFIFISNMLIPNPELPAVAFVTGTVQLETRRGTLTLQDSSAFSLEADGLFGGVETVLEGTDSLMGTTGRIHTSGVFQNGCVSCDYRGEICSP